MPSNNSWKKIQEKEWRNTGKDTWIWENTFLEFLEGFQVKFQAIIFEEQPGGILARNPEGVPEGSHINF